MVRQCRDCGTCVADCPGQAIHLANVDDRQLVDGGLLGRWMPGAEMPAETPWRPEITALTCQYCGNVPVEMAGAERLPVPV